MSTKSSFMESFILPRVMDYFANAQEGEVDLGFFGDFFPNGLAFRPKESRAVIINAGNKFHSFMLAMKGYCFLHELLPDKKDWSHESDKWWVIPNPENELSVDDVVNFLAHFKGVAPILSDTDKEDMVLNKPKYALPDIESRLFTETGVIFFQDATGQKRIGNRPVEFRQFVGGTKLGEQIKLRTEISPYYVCSYFPYAFEVIDQEDINNIPTMVQFVIRAKCVNPYIAHVKSGNAFATFESIATSSASDIIRQNPIHKASQKFYIDNGGSIDKNGTILDVMSKGIRDELFKPDKFFGFAFKEIEIIQVEISGENAKKLKESAASIYLAQQDQEKRTIDAETDFIEKKKEIDGKVLGKIRLARADAIADMARSKGTGDYLRAIKNAGGNPNLHLLAEVMDKYKPGGLNVSNVADLLKNVNLETDLPKEELKKEGK